MVIEREGVINLEFGIKRYVLPYTKQINNKADSFCFIAKTNTTLQSNYTPIKNKWINEIPQSE